MRAVLFDLGNTLVRYWNREDMPVIRKTCVAGVAKHLLNEGLISEKAAAAAEELFARENFEDNVWRVRPLEERLIRCFGLPPEFGAKPAAMEMCAAFTRPFFEISRIYPDTVPVLSELHGMGIKLAIVTNLAWGSPAPLWHREIERHGLMPLVDAVVTCRDVGWRKPALVIFEHTAALLGVTPADCMFVGDDPRWDYVGAQGAGMKPILIVREGSTETGHDTIRDLASVVELVKASM